MLVYHSLTYTSIMMIVRIIKYHTYVHSFSENKYTIFILPAKSFSINEVCSKISSWQFFSYLALYCFDK